MNTVQLLNYCKKHVNKTINAYLKISKGMYTSWHALRWTNSKKAKRTQRLIDTMSCGSDKISRAAFRRYYPQSSWFVMPVELKK